MTSFLDNMQTIPNATCAILLDEGGAQCGRRVTGWATVRVDGKTTLITACPDHASDGTTVFAQVMSLPTGDRLDRLVDDALGKEPQS